ncbi:MAG: DUF421 domain-containing protein [Clostridiales bacterium]|nr:DUF421 domain-containing protein [Clostridiales bacterium]
MDIIKVILTSILSVVVLFVLTKLMGNRQMSQLSMFDYINGITIGSIAAEMATSLENDFWLPLIAMVIYAVAGISITFVTTKSLKARRFLAGRSVVLFNNGKFYRKDMRRAQIDMSEFMVQCRINGCFDLSQLECAVLESNGRISFLMKSDSRPVQPSDLNITPAKESIFPTVILDGCVLDGNLKAAGYDKAWLDKELIRLKCSLNEIMLGEIDNNGQLAAYSADNKKEKRDIFQ